MLGRNCVFGVHEKLDVCEWWVLKRVGLENDEESYKEGKGKWHMTFKQVSTVFCIRII